MKKRAVLRTGMATAIAITGLSFGAASASSAATKAAAKKSLTHISIGVAAAAADQVITFYAQDDGFFKKYGIDATVKLLPSTEFVGALTGGAVQFGVNGAPQPEEAMAAGSPFRWIGVWADKPDLDFIVGPGITSFTQLVGKPIGGTAAGSLTQILAQNVLEQHGVKQTQVSWRDVGTPPNLLAAFIAHEIDAAVTGPPLVTVALAKTPGAHKLYTLTKNYKWPFAGLVANMTWANAHEKVTVDVLKAMNAAVKSWKKHASKAEAVLMAEVPGATHTEAVGSYKSTIATLHASLKPLKAAEQVVLKTISKTFPAVISMTTSQFIDMKFLKKAGLVGKKK